MSNPKSENKTAVIIGGGMGGLFTGALLSKNGIRVTVLEKNAVIGGGLQCFTRRNRIFETGVHIMGGFGDGGSLNRICRYLGILDRLKIQRINADCMDEIYVSSGSRTFRIPSGREEFVKRLSSYFPEEARGIRTYVDEIFRLADEVPLFSLKPEADGIAVHSDRFFIPADTLIADHVTDIRLQRLLAYLNPLYGGVKGHTPAYIHALINVLYISGASRFIGGSQQLADALADVVVSNGGEVVPGCKVELLDINGRHVNGVTADNGKTYSADYYVSAVHPLTMLSFVNRGTFTPAFVKRLQQIPLSVSAFTLFIDLKPDSFEYIDHTCYFTDDYESIWSDSQVADTDVWPKGFMYMTPPDENQGKFASRMIIHCVMDYSQASEWSLPGQRLRQPGYEEWKKECTEKILDKMERLFPRFRDSIENIWSASPLTIRDYYNSPRGALFGYRKDSDDLMLSQLSVYTKIDNLFLTGQNINLHGVCGVPLTAINTAEAILGRNSILSRLQEF